MDRKSFPLSPKSPPSFGARGRRARLLTTLALLGATAVCAPAAHADEVSPSGKGIAGGILLGGEVVTITESLIGVRSGWAYLIGGGLGAVGGGLGGFAVEQASANGQGATYMLAGGMALIIPALVLTLNATRYRPSENATEDKPPPGLAPADPGAPGGSAVSGPAAAPPPPPAPAAAPPPTSLLDLSIPRETGLRMGVPVPDVRPMYTASEQRAYGLPQRAEVRMPVFRLTF